MLWFGMAGLAVSLGLLSLSGRLKTPARDRLAMIGATLVLGAASVVMIGWHAMENMG